MQFFFCDSNDTPSFSAIRNSVKRTRGSVCSAFACTSADDYPHTCGSMARCGLRRGREKTVRGLAITGEVGCGVGKRQRVRGAPALMSPISSCSG